jgi:hypothetical protein
MSGQGTGIDCPHLATLGTLFTLARSIVGIALLIVFGAIW